MKTINKINIHLPKTKYFVSVVLYQTVKELKEATKENDVAGMYHPEPYVIYPKRKVGKKLGTIHLAKERLGVGYITHEVLHCVFDWWDKVYCGISLENDEDQEKACQHQGYISKEIVNWLNDKKLWD